MNVYRLTDGIALSHNNNVYLIENQQWDAFINDDNLFKKLKDLSDKLTPAKEGKALLKNVLAPIGSQELWACGVTYLRSKVGRQEESKGAGGGDFYARVYEAERPEVFFKAPGNRVVGPGAKVRIRKDSSWDAPEPELTLVVTTSGKIVGYTIGNDMSSRSIEGENPLYLPQAKMYDGAAAVGPCIYVTENPLPPNTTIQMEVLRDGKVAFEGSIEISQMKRTPQELVKYLYREMSYPDGCMVMTGTGIVPGSDFTLKEGDEVRITIEPIGTLTNPVAR